MSQNSIEQSDYKKLSYSIDVSKKLQPITFCYSKSSESPKDHVLHINQFYEIYIYIRGDTDYIVRDSYFPLKYGDIIIVNPYEVHKAVLKSDDLYERFYFLVPTKTFSEFVFDPLEKIISNTFQKKHLISLDKDVKKRIVDLLYQMVDVLTNDCRESGQMLAYGMFLQFITMISNSAFETASARTGVLPQIIWDILKYIDANLTQIESVEEIATHFNLSGPYLSTTFKSAIGTSVIKYIQTRRIAYAKTMLWEGKSVTEACYESGFHDCAYFIKIFKQHTGMTPLKYKKTSDVGAN